MLPKIELKKINKEYENDWDFIYIFLDEYYKIIDNEDADKIAENFTESQNTLLAFCDLDAQINNGGFIQLIHNGYGKYIFESDFSENIKIRGAIKIASILDKVRILYNKNKDKIQKEMSLEDFSELYSKFTEFEKFDDEYYQVSELETKIISQYIKNNLKDFGEII